MKFKLKDRVHHIDGLYEAGEYDTVLLIGEGGVWTQVRENEAYLVSEADLELVHTPRANEEIAWTAIEDYWDSTWGTNTTEEEFALAFAVILAAIEEALRERTAESNE